MKPVQLGVIGLGLIWEWVHQPNLVDIHDVSLAQYGAPKKYNKQKDGKLWNIVN